MSKQEEAGLILKLYELRREDTMRKARDWYFREFNPQSMADFNAAMFGEHSGHVRMVIILLGHGGGFGEQWSYQSGALQRQQWRTHWRLRENRAAARRNPSRLWTAICAPTSKS